MFTEPHRGSDGPFHVISYYNFGWMANFWVDSHRSNGSSDVKEIGHPAEVSTPAGPSPDELRNEPRNPSGLPGKDRAREV